jgi:hypothetical protein
MIANLVPVRGDYPLIGQPIAVVTQILAQNPGTLLDNGQFS